MSIEVGNPRRTAAPVHTCSACDRGAWCSDHTTANIEERSERACIRGCRRRGEHFAGCPDFGTNNGGCRGCVPAKAKDRALVCQRCFRAIARHVEDAPQLIHMLQTRAASAVVAPTDRVRVSGSPVEPVAPAAADVVDATNDIMRSLRDWASWVNPSIRAVSGWRRQQIGATAASADYAQIIVGALDVLANRTEVVGLADAMLLRHEGDPAWWSVADALARWPLTDRRHWASTPCPECGLKTVKVTPPQSAGAATLYRCEQCEWERDDSDDKGLWAIAFEAARV